MIIKNALRLKCIILISSVLGGLWLGFGLIFAGIDLWLDPYKPNFKTAVRLIRNNHKIKTEIIKKCKFFFQLFEINSNSKFNHYFQNNLNNPVPTLLHFCHVLPVLKTG